MRAGRLRGMARNACGQADSSGCNVCDYSNNARNRIYLLLIQSITTLITPIQCGFRKQHSTTDRRVRLESFIREASIQQQHAVAVFYDLEKAYDCTRKYGIM